jgi:hypothetical protein
MTWPRALRAFGVALLLVAAVLLVGANFTPVELRLWTLTLEVRLGWVVAAGLFVGFVAGHLYASAGDRDEGGEHLPRRPRA